jgi:lipoprotein signal peptidase
VITTADKLNTVTWAFSLFSVLIVLLIALSWYRKKRLSLFNKAAILIVLAGMASFADAYWIEPNWLKTEQVVIHDAFTPTFALPRRGGGITVPGAGTGFRRH